MNDEEFIDFVADFLSSDDWVVPTIDFMMSNCSSFNESSYNSLEEYKIYLQYTDLLENIITNTLCTDIGVSFEEFQSKIISNYDLQNYRAKTITESISKSLDFSKFKEDMLRYKEDLEEEEEIIEPPENLDYETQASFILGSEVPQNTFKVTPPLPRQEDTTFKIKPPDFQKRSRNIRAKILQRKRTSKQAEIVKPNMNGKISYIRNQINTMQKYQPQISA
ncbi:hypothetical protein TVAG_445120 [Trichomonas vaginalis G3]|uniref:Cilia- and flagella-associated protein 36 n=1 Tax=Trichomonas vaginalis (strain ATCC PRA-98 / G3) TaxID=412133 RepID=A2E4H9_TRIV3|nr:ARF-like 2 binding protein BART family [Trichomonas vaginalis G3]EAY12401.1 hypothetical protein TVAG_445120 [Trichomonas vaginalis G3]KAI5494164.1 ARF-like 2 binding protein BART family [Trichomonas vaginalis G3]|eukprot:XP_001324624.1 hypothetical protein [Trichomonas vaginalis G3]